MNSLRYAASIGLGLAGLTFAAVVCVGSSSAVHGMPAPNSLFGLAALAAGVCFVTHTLCLWRLLGQADAALHGSTQRTQSMIDALSDGVLILDSNDRIVLANRTVAEWTGRPAFALAGLPADVLNWRSAENEALTSPPWRRSGIAGNAPIDLEAALGDDEGNVHLARLDARPIAENNVRHGTLIVLRPAINPARLPRVGDIALALRQARTADAELDSLLRLSKELVETCQTVLDERAEAAGPGPPLVVEAT